MRKDNERPYITADFFGSCRFINLSNKNDHTEDDLFFSIERRDADGNYISQKEYGYIRKTKEMKNFIKNEFFTGCSGVKFIQWPDSWNVVFDELSIIGGISYEMSFEEFNKLFPSKKDTIKAIEDAFAEACKDDSFEGTMSYILDCLIDRTFEEWNSLSDRLFQLSDKEINELLIAHGDDECFVFKNGKLCEKKAS